LERRCDLRQGAIGEPKLPSKVCKLTALKVALTIDRRENWIKDAPLRFHTWLKELIAQSVR